MQPGLTVVLGDSDGNHFVHGIRGIHAQEDNLGNWEYMAQDGLGSVRGLLDDAAVVQSSMSYDPVGNPMGSYGAGYLYAGEQVDANDLVYLRARYYEPSLGVFSARDPFEGLQNRPMSLNGYSWVEGNVPNDVDPTGMQSECSISPCSAFSGTSRILCEQYATNFLPVCPEGKTGCEGQDKLNCTLTCYPRVCIGALPPVIPPDMYDRPCIEGSSSPEDRQNCAVQAYRAAQRQLWGQGGFTWVEFLSLTITGEISTVASEGTICGGVSEPKSGVPAGDCQAMFWRGAEAVVRKLLYIKCPSGTCTIPQLVEFLGETQAWYHAAQGSGSVNLDRLLGSGSGPSLQYTAFIDNVACYLAQGLPEGPVEWGNMQNQSDVDNNNLTLENIKMGIFKPFSLAYKEVRAIAAIPQETGYFLRIPQKQGEDPQSRSLFVLQYGVDTGNTVKSTCSPN